MNARGRALVVLVAALLGAALTARLGVWQLDRADQKIRLQQAMQQQRALPPLVATELARDAGVATTQFHRAVVLHGRWLASQTVYLDNRQMNGRPGFFALTPLQLPGDGGVVLVQRGWLPRDLMDRTRIAAVPAPAGEVQVLGRLAPAPARLYDFAGGASGPIRQNLELEAFARETGLKLRPFTVVQEERPEAVADGLLRQWPLPATDVHKHYGYAFQWFALCALILGLYVWFQFLHPRRIRRRLAHHA